MRSCVIIPARYSSSRFPGKPLVSLLGKPMVLWVAELSAKAVGKQNVFVATEDERIAKVVREAGFSALLTSPQALTGTDRLAEAAKMVDYDTYINVQGDEPLVEPGDILQCISIKSENPDVIVNGFCWIEHNEDPASVNIPKVIANETGFMVYMSRSPLPGFKDTSNAPLKYMKQVCIYGFNRDELQAFASYERKSSLERHEDIEILRFLELNRRILMYECSPGSLAVDVPEDVAKVEEVLKNRATS
ncbi:3-deoxy-manno-octulosonate cytidylyltransferase [Synechococcus sp. CS-1328]|uniref:3-deoxy-manno-octulosonate cytidylyltransferase n=1 Tax=Synechococcus sp. CS-1328 TaxID=2847976 RepID=UPI00223ACD56|nr:3-deoxy-manno-octulosonate cytidylyltransferase [Synechococcus sp. CS-1328]MCT0224368.1 3-deoxy-manno-octulosonate cytidylyltransferase [Synechococcus sp. CS-1328]